MLHAKLVMYDSNALIMQSNGFERGQRDSLSSNVPEDGKEEKDNQIDKEDADNDVQQPCVES